MLGAFIQGFKVDGRHFAGTAFDWMTPFALLVGVALMFGYALLGAGWLVLKTESTLQTWAKGAGRVALVGVTFAILSVSIWTPLSDAHIAARWFSWPHVIFLAPLPLITSALVLVNWFSFLRNYEIVPFLSAIGLFLMSFIGIAVSLWPMVVPFRYSLWQAQSSASTQAFFLIGTLFLLPVILMYTAWSYWVFRGKIKRQHGLPLERELILDSPTDGCMISQNSRPLSGSKACLKSV